MLKCTGSVTLVVLVRYSTGIYQYGVNNYEVDTKSRVRFLITCVVAGRYRTYLTVGKNPTTNPFLLELTYTIGDPDVKRCPAYY